jgi:hypothetical protein
MEQGVATSLVSTAASSQDGPADDEALVLSPPPSAPSITDDPDLPWNH